MVREGKKTLNEYGNRTPEQPAETRDESSEQPAEIALDSEENEMQNLESPEIAPDPTPLPDEPRTGTKRKTRDDDRDVWNKPGLSGIKLRVTDYQAKGVKLQKQGSESPPDSYEDPNKTGEYSNDDGVSSRSDEGVETVEEPTCEIDDETYKPLWKAKKRAKELEKRQRTDQMKSKKKKSKKGKKELEGKRLQTDQILRKKSKKGKKELEGKRKQTDQMKSKKKSKKEKKELEGNGQQTDQMKSKKKSKKGKGEKSEDSP